MLNLTPEKVLIFRITHIACVQDRERQVLEKMTTERALDLKVITQPEWFFE